MSDITNMTDVRPSDDAPAAASASPSASISADASGRDGEHSPAPRRRKRRPWRIKEKSPMLSRRNLLNAALGADAGMALASQGPR